MNSDSNHEDRDDEIDLIELIKIIWSKRVFVIRVTVVFFAFGILIVSTSKVEYQASCKLMPESQEGAKSNFGGLSGLAGLAGIDLGTGANGSLTPDIYPEIVRSVPFQLDLIYQPIRFEKLDSTLSSFNFFKEFDNPSLIQFIYNYTIKLPLRIKDFFSDSEVTNTNASREYGNLIRLTKEEWDLIEKFQDRVEIEVDATTGIISIITEMPDPYAAAMIADVLVFKLTEEVINYKTEKTKVNLEFIEERYQEAKLEYEDKQNNFALFVDRNKNLSSSLIQTEYQRLQNDLNISFEVYKGLATQLEQAKIKVKEETPVFTFLEPVKVPVNKSKPKMKIILVIFTVLGIIFSSAYIIFLNRSQIF